MPAPSPTPIDLVFPRKGVHRGTTYAGQPPETTYAMSNMRVSDNRIRSGGGKRDGTRRATATQAGPVTGPRITGLVPITQAQGAPASGAASTAYAVADDFQSYSVGTGVSLQGGTTATAHEYIRQYVGSTGILNVVSQSGYNILGVAGDPNNVNPKRIQFQGVFNATGASDGAVTFGPNFASRNDSLTRWRVLGQCLFGAGNNWGPNDACVGCGPFIRGNVNKSEFVVAYLRPTAANTVRLEIAQVLNQTLTVIAQTAAFPALSGGAGYPVLDADNLELRLFEASATTVTATVKWNSEAIALTSLTATTTLPSTNPMAGAAQVAYVVSGGSSTNTRRDLRFLQMVRLAPSTYLPVLTIDGATAGPGANFYLPSSTVGVYRSAAAAFTESLPLNTSAADPVWPAIDEANNRINGTVGGGAGEMGFITDTLPLPDQQYGIDFRAWTTLAATHAGGCPVLRISEDRRSFLFLGYALNQANSTTSGMLQISFSNNRQGELVSNGAIIETDVIASGPINNVVFHVDSYVRVTDDGTSIRFYVNGLLRYTYSPTALATSTLAGNKRIGIGHTPSAIAGATSTFMRTCRIVPGEVPASTDMTEVKDKVLVCSDSNFNILDVEAETLTNVTTSQGLQNAVPMGVSFNRKFYVVDGAQQKIVDPNALTVVDWGPSVTKGTLPTLCRLVELYRGRVILARQSSDPTIWYASRVNDPLDWDFGADPQRSSATAGNNGKVGQPSDAITALVTWEDDYLIFGCATRMYILEGDPGYDGAIQLLTKQTGISGPRAWCFDHEASLYFVGANGLYRLTKGNRTPELVSGDRLAYRLDRLNLSQTLIQLAFDASQRLVMIFLTPTDGTPAEHLAYDVIGDAFLPDEYPLNFGPWAVCEINGKQDDDRRVLMGGDDGYIRRFDVTKYADDTGSTGETAIDAWVEFGPFSLSGGKVESVLEKLSAEIGDNTNGPVTWYWFAAQSAQELALQDFGQEQATGFWGGGALVTNGAANGWQDPVSQRVRGAYHKLRVRLNSSTATFTLEAISAMLQARSQRGLRYT